ncbi:tyrosine-type recombinase/integrase [Arcobacter peruensis]|uniref:tyrosine-type recombinase/integrase n=1 Tax=Arcobacter peruensis TaxID=2320140 RepID=UPI000F093280|nr:integrase arm-type DNA-binding domain-containing protein [Arcobacter peruensis]
MPKIPTPLSDTKISKAKAKLKEYELNDGKGLSLIIKPNGSKIWRFRYISPITNKRRKKSLGSYPGVTLEKAREHRGNNIMLLEEGKDPIETVKEIAVKEKNKDRGLFINVMNEWFEIQKPNITAVTYKKKYQIFVSSVLPFFKDKHIKDITKLELLEVLEKKQETATETASRLFNYLSKLWAYAVLKDYCSYNYLGNINKNDVLTKKRIVNNYPKITDKETFKELVNSIYKYKGTPSIVNALKLVLHIPLRANNLCNLKWDNIDFNNKLLTIPRNQMKVKNHNLNDFILPLTDEVINILNEQKEYSTKYAELKEFIFIGNDNKKPICKESPNQALIRLGFTANKKQSLHGFRGSFRTIAEEHQEEHKANDKIMESILDHSKDTKIESAYKNKVNYLPQQRPLLEWWSNYIMDLL